MSTIKPNLQLIKYLDSPWEASRADLRTDLETIENAFNNRQTLAGQVLLVGGTALIETADIQPGRLIWLSHAIIIGSPGFLSYSQIDGVSFRIISTSATDASYVNWLIFDAR
jgi:hypothetical protein